MVGQALGETETTFLQLLAAGVGQDLQASPGVFDYLLHSQSLQVSEVVLGQTLADALLQGEEDAGGSEEARSPVAEGVLHAGVGDDALCHPPQLPDIHSLGEEEPGYDVVQVVHGCRAGQFPP